MFAKDKVSQSLIDAVNKVITKEEVKEQLNEAFPTVADAQKRANEPKPRGGAGIKLGTRYGGGRQADEPEDDEGEKTPAKREKYGARKTRFTNTKLYKEDEVQEELKGNQHKIDANKNGKIDAHDFQLLRGKKKKMTEGYTFAERLVESMYGKKSALPLDEKEMSDAQKKKREDIVMSMKKDTEGMKKRYGSRWKDVMYATATKQAMKETYAEEVELDEKLDYSERTTDTLAGRVKGGKDNEHFSSKVKLEDDVEEDKMDEAAKKQNYDKDEVAKKIGAAMNKADDAVRKGRAEREAARAIASAKYGSKMKNEEVELDEEQLDELSKDTLKSYTKAAKKSANVHMNKFMQNVDGDDDDYKKAVYHQGKEANRLTGIDRAKKKLKSFSSMKNEMLGKAGMTSEKKDEE